MRMSALIVVAVAFASPESPQADTPPEQFLLDEQRAGTTTLGSSVDLLINRVPMGSARLVNLNLEGHFTPAIEARLKGMQRHS